jgi:metal-sulfur cluster biosynthetic enzyme
MSQIQPADVTLALRQVIDPEVGLNVVDLGLIYALHVDDADNVRITMTLTTRHCPMGEVLPESCRQMVIFRTKAPAVAIDLVWDPPWSPERISSQGKQLLGIECD